MTTPTPTPALVLQNAQENHLLILLSWFADANSLRRWGGPHMQFPVTLNTLRHDIRSHEWDTYALLEQAADGSLRDAPLVAFGQVVERLQRHHLGRLAVAPDKRGRGYGQQLIRHLLFAAQSNTRREEASLLVYRDNLPAWHCYRSLGFEQVDCPPSLPQQEGVVFMCLKLPPRPEQIFDL